VSKNLSKEKRMTSSRSSKNVGYELCRRRQRLGFTQDYVAGELGLSQPEVSRLEYQKYSNGSSRRLSEFYDEMERSRGIEYMLEHGVLEELLRWLQGGPGNELRSAG
jgi:transcriptional regulator with XRE-family HTH domain